MPDGIEDVTTSETIGDLESQIAALRATQLDSEGKGEPSELNRSIFAVLAAALPTALGAALGGKKGALSGLAGSEKTTNALLQAELKRELTADPTQKRIDKLSDILTKEKLARERIEFKGEVDPSATKLTVKLEGKGSEQVQKELIETGLQRKALESQALNILNIIDRGRRADELPDAETTAEAFVKNKLVFLDPDTARGDLKRAVLDNLLEKLKSIKGNASETENALVRDAAGVGDAVPVQLYERIAREMIAKARRAERDIEDFAIEKGLDFVGKDKAVARRQKDFNAAVGNAVKIGSESELTPDLLQTLPLGGFVYSEESGTLFKFDGEGLVPQIL